ncbi:OsmC family protein [Paenibacillus apiarius]|uniref:OsmC family protein n=1 Tax=Paenibacillus apiarius TaxID=46240 RepID=A0ABT4DY23_9BACL|nr:OsmC family protein [Paenibacillus apiarius]MCY9517485.1 OsmC family protein [Paenibacillus apiarius]MCY9522236.1 OsmC family protein [Paenibacillus apiarius]MCY9552269.1 OsmC family protein [Paenibacillus apiarius]MCY9560149.1 OsmC family protein [Paenibacillus apiarius]MCY9683767.1 OsmC family protein [Paenibacillus apiarius]
MPLETFKATAHLQKGMVVKAKSRNFEITVDEPKNLGGTDTAMNPVELVLCALGACQSIVARAYAPKFKIKLEEFWVEVEGELDTDGFMNKSDVRRGYSDIRYNIHIKSNASREQVEEFVQFIERTCPVGDTINNPVNLVLNEIILE